MTARMAPSHETRLHPPTVFRHGRRGALSAAVARRAGGAGPRIALDRGNLGRCPHGRHGASAADPGVARAAADRLRGRRAARTGAAQFRLRLQPRTDPTTGCLSGRGRSAPGLAATPAPTLVLVAQAVRRPRRVSSERPGARSRDVRPRQHPPRHCQLGDGPKRNPGALPVAGRTDSSRAQWRGRGALSRREPGSDAGIVRSEGRRVSAVVRRLGVGTEGTQVRPPGVVVRANADPRRPILAGIFGGSAASRRAYPEASRGADPEGSRRADRLGRPVGAGTPVRPTAVGRQGQVAGRGQGQEAGQPARQRHLRRSDVGPGARLRGRGPVSVPADLRAGCQRRF